MELRPPSDRAYGYRSKDFLTHVESSFGSRCGTTPFCVVIVAHQRVGLSPTAALARKNVGHDQAPPLVIMAGFASWGMGAAARPGILIGGMVNGFQIAAIGSDNECGVIARMIMRADAGRSVIISARCQCRFIEFIDSLTIGRRQGDV